MIVFVKAARSPVFQDIESTGFVFFITSVVCIVAWQCKVLPTYQGDHFYLVLLLNYAQSSIGSPQSPSKLSINLSSFLTFSPLGLLTTFNTTFNAILAKSLKMSWKTGMDFKP